LIFDVNVKRVNDGRRREKTESQSAHNVTILASSRVRPKRERRGSFRGWKVFDNNNNNNNIVTPDGSGYRPDWRTWRGSTSTKTIIMCVRVCVWLRRWKLRDKRRGSSRKRSHRDAVNESRLREGESAYYYCYHHHMRTTLDTSWRGEL